ncbi:MAG: hypothetical protein R3281_05380 [Balneolaceae bacterium]|nr:hypothetical protein [Balneolaceae bacterium]
MNRTLVVSLISALGLSLLQAAPARSQPETAGLGQGGDVRSENEAISQALTNTIMPVAVGYGSVKLFNSNTIETIGSTLAVYGLVIGPSTGNFYANDYLRGGLGALTRVGAAFLLKDATSEIFGREFADALNVDNKSVRFGDTEVIVGAVMMVGTMAYNIISAPVSVSEYNQSMGYAIKLHSLPGTGRTIPVVTARIQL